MHEVKLGPMSKAVMSKLRNGRPCRCSMVEGEGVSAILNEENIKKLLRAGRLGKKATLALTGGELEENKVKGTGIMSGGRIKLGKALKSIVSSKPAQALKEKAKKEITKKIQQVAEEKMEEAGVPSPIARAIAKKGSKMAVDKADKKISGKGLFDKAKRAASSVAKSKAGQALKEKAKKEAQKRLQAAAEEKMKEAGIPPSIAKQIAKKGSSVAVDQADKKISGGATLHRGKDGKMTAEPSSRPFEGGAIGSRARVESVGHPGTLLGRHYSNASQAADANFHQRFQLGPLVSGAGLYSSEGRGIY